MNKAIFLDRDGTLNHDPYGYISKPEDFNLFPYTLDALKIMSDLGYKLIVVSNQSGIARGYFTETDLKLIHDKLLSLTAQSGINLDKIYYCPYHPDGTLEEYKQDSDLRKPQTGMFELAHKEFDIKKISSFMIGDKYDDILFARNAGLKSILLLSGYGKKTYQELPSRQFKPDFIAEDLLAAANLIKLLNLQKKI
jgi:D,D-heptose 1,7-bisphosphate phosphatase